MLCVSLIENKPMAKKKIHKKLFDNDDDD